MKVRIALAPNKFAGGGEIPPYRTGDPSVLKRDLNNRVILPSFNDLFSNHRPEDIYEEEGYIPLEQGKGHQYTYNDIYTDYIGRLNKYNQSLPVNDNANILTNEKRTSQGLNRIGDTGAMPVVNDMFKGVNTLLGYGMQAPVELAKTALMPGSYIPYVGATNQMGELMNGAVDNTAGALFAPIMPSNYIDWGSAGRDGIHLKLPWQSNSNGVETPAFMLTMDFAAAPYLAKGVNRAVKLGKRYVNPFYEGKNNPVNLIVSKKQISSEPVSIVSERIEPITKLTLEEKLGLPKHVRKELSKTNPSGKYLEGAYYLEDRLNAMESARKKLNSSSEKGVDNLLLESYPSTQLSEDGVVTNKGDLTTGAFINERSYRDVNANVGFGRNGFGGHNYGVNMAGAMSKKSDLYPEDKILVESPKSEYVVTDKDMARTKKGTRGLLKAMKGMESGAEFSGDAAATTMGEALAAWLRVAKRKPNVKKIAMDNAKAVLQNKVGIKFGYNDIYDPIRDIYTSKSGMSPDAYYYLYKVALKNPDTFSIGYSTLPAGKFNSFAVTPQNKYMYDIEQQLINNVITPKQYVEKYNEWTLPVGGRRAYIRENGKIYKPQPFLIHKAYGGNLFPDGGTLDDDDIPMYGSTQQEAVVTGHRMPTWNRFWNKNFRSKSGWDKYVDRYYARQQQMQDTNNNPNPNYEVPDALSIAGIIAGTPYNEDIERAKVWDTYNNWKEHSEIIGPHYDPDGNYHNDTYANPSAGYLSNADPAGEFLVLNEALGPLAKFIGRGTQQVMARAGNQWARNQIMGRAFNNAADASFGFNNRFVTTPAMTVPTQQLTFKPTTKYLKSTVPSEFDDIFKHNNPLFKELAAENIEYKMEPTIRTKLGDIEINNPELGYRQGSVYMGEDFIKNNIVRTDGHYKNPLFAEGKLWYGTPTEKMLAEQPEHIFTTKSGLRFNFSKRNEAAPKTDLLVTTADNLKLADHNSIPMKEIFTKDGVTKVRGDYNPRRIPKTEDILNQNNTNLFRYDPTYGYRRVESPVSLADPFNVNTLVDVDGNITKSAKELLLKLYHRYPFIKMSNITNKGFKKRTNLAQHISDVVKSALEYPLPEGVTRQDFVTSALYHDLGKIINGQASHGNTSNYIISQLRLPATKDVIQAVGSHMNPQEYFESATPLERALHAADVGRGRPYNELVENFPYLDYRKTTPTTNSAKTSLKFYEKPSKLAYEEWTPEQWTAAQDAAIARGDMTEAQRLRDLHFKIYQNGDMVDINGNPIHVYHGSPEENITEFYKPNDSRLPTPKGINYKATGEEGIYTSPRKGYAANYMADLGGRYRIPLTKEQKALLKAGKTREEIGLPSIPQGRLYDLYSNTKLVPEDLNIEFNPFTLSTEEAKLIKSKGYSGFDIPGKKYPEHVVLEPNQLKLADAVTYNDNGIRIPLGKRDNFNINDIRYGLAPLGIGIPYLMNNNNNQ